METIGLAQVICNKLEVIEGLEPGTIMFVNPYRWRLYRQGAITLQEFAKHCYVIRNAGTVPEDKVKDI